MSIRVLLVEDSKIAQVILQRILTISPHIEIVGIASTGVEAITLIPTTQPDVICTDFHMPKMNGLEFTHEVMSRYPRPILVISASVQTDDTHRIFQVLEAGAVDIFPKPITGLVADNPSFNQGLIEKIQVLSGVKVFTKKRRIASQNALSLYQDRSFIADPSFKPQIVTIGASTGGPQALQELFSQIPASFPLPIICVQHICAGFLEGFIHWLSGHCALPIQIAQLGEKPKAGQIYFPSERQHLELDQNGRFCCTHLSPVDGHCPSITVTFKSIAQFYGKQTIGILLTGMGRDGAEGLRSISEVGGFTIAQDEATSVVFGMPKEAILLGAVQQVLPIQAVAPALLKLIQSSLCSMEQIP
jgi:two-component system, chemotaxis family, protein-glutamate methylesterase/glutaminase